MTEFAPVENLPTEATDVEKICRSYHNYIHTKTGNLYRTTDVKTTKLKIDGEWRDTKLVEYYALDTLVNQRTGKESTRVCFDLRFIREAEDFVKSFKPQEKDGE